LEIEDQYKQLKNERDRIRLSVDESKEELSSEQELLGYLEKARWVLTEVTRLTQVEFKDYVETLVTSALQTVYDRPLEFKLLFERRSGRLHCIPKVYENGEEFELDEELGGGAIDVVSFAFRVVLWSLQVPKSRATFVLDEPMKFVGKGELLERAGMVFREVSDKLGFQLIIVTHEPQLTQIADKVFHVTHNGKRSTVTETDEVKE
jgi:DNA repair exonuclease SbcCD ATPase subunit